MNDDQLAQLSDCGIATGLYAFAALDEQLPSGEKLRASGVG